MMNDHEMKVVESLELRLVQSQYMILDLFAQACQISTGDGTIKYDHLCISAYEDAQQFLIECGIIKEEQCERL